MKTHRLVCVLAMVSLVSGCYVQSLHVFYSDETRTAVPGIVGEWESKIQLGKELTEKNITPWTFTEDRIETYDTENRYGELEVVYFKVDGTLFVDFTAGEPFRDAEFNTSVYWGAGITRVHSLCKVEQKEEQLTLTPLNIQWFSDRIEKDMLDLPYVKPVGPDRNFVFTATPEQWQQFLDEHKDDRDVFNPKYRFVFRKKNVE